MDRPAGQEKSTETEVAQLLIKVLSEAPNLKIGEFLAIYYPQLVIPNISEIANLSIARIVLDLHWNGTGINWDEVLGGKAETIFQLIEDFLVETAAPVIEDAIARIMTPSLQDMKVLDPLTVGGHKFIQGTQHAWPKFLLKLLQQINSEGYVFVWLCEKLGLQEVKSIHELFQQIKSVTSAQLTFEFKNKATSAAVFLYLALIDFGSYVNSQSDQFEHFMAQYLYDTDRPFVELVGVTNASHLRSTIEPIKNDSLDLLRMDPNSLEHRAARVVGLESVRRTKDSFVQKLSELNLQTVVKMQQDIKSLTEVYNNCRKWGVGLLKLNNQGDVDTSNIIAALLDVINGNATPEIREIDPQLRSNLIKATRKLAQSEPLPQFVDSLPLSIALELFVQAGFWEPLQGYLNSQGITLPFLLDAQLRYHGEHLQRIQLMGKDIIGLIDIIIAYLEGADLTRVQNVYLRAALTQLGITNVDWTNVSWLELRTKLASLDLTNKHVDLSAHEFNYYLKATGNDGAPVSEEAETLKKTEQLLQGLYNLFTQSSRSVIFSGLFLTSSNEITLQANSDRRYGYINLAEQLTGNVVNTALPLTMGLDLSKPEYGWNTLYMSVKGAQPAPTNVDIERDTKVAIAKQLLDPKYEFSHDQYFTLLARQLVMNYICSMIQLENPKYELGIISDNKFVLKIHINKEEVREYPFSTSKFVAETPDQLTMQENIILAFTQSLEPDFREIWGLLTEAEKEHIANNIPPYAVSALIFQARAYPQNIVTRFIDSITYDGILNSMPAGLFAKIPTPSALLEFPQRNLKSRFHKLFPGVVYTDELVKYVPDIFRCVRLSLLHLQIESLTETQLIDITLIISQLHLGDHADIANQKLRDYLQKHNLVDLQLPSYYRFLNADMTASAQSDITLLQFYTALPANPSKLISNFIEIVQIQYRLYKAYPQNNNTAEIKHLSEQRFMRVLPFLNSSVVLTQNVYLSSEGSYHSLLQVMRQLLPLGEVIELGNLLIAWDPLPPFGLQVVKFQPYQLGDNNELDAEVVAALSEHFSMSVDSSNFTQLLYKYLVDTNGFYLTINDKVFGIKADGGLWIGKLEGSEYLTGSVKNSDTLNAINTWITNHSTENEKSYQRIDTQGNLLMENVHNPSILGYHGHHCLGAPVVLDCFRSLHQLTRGGEFKSLIDLVESLTNKSVIVQTPLRRSSILLRSAGI